MWHFLPRAGLCLISRAQILLLWAQEGVQQVHAVVMFGIPQPAGKARCGLLPRGCCMRLGCSGQLVGVGGPELAAAEQSCAWSLCCLGPSGRQGLLTLCLVVSRRTPGAQQRAVEPPVASWGLCNESPVTTPFPSAAAPLPVPLTAASAGMRQHS